MTSSKKVPPALNVRIKFGDGDDVLVTHTDYINTTANQLLAQAEAMMQSDSVVLRLRGKELKAKILLQLSAAATAVVAANVQRARAAKQERPKRKSKLKPLIVAAMQKARNNDAELSLKDFLAAWTQQGQDDDLVIGLVGAEYVIYDQYADDAAPQKSYSYKTLEGYWSAAPPKKK